MEWLKDVAKDHKEWVKLVKSFGEDLYAEDLVQECYLRLYKYCKPENVITNGQINKGFMYFTLRNMYLYGVRNKGKFEGFDIEAIQIKDEPSQLDKHEAYLKILGKIENEVDSWHWYDQKLFELYRDTDLSIRDIAAETKISSSSIFNTLKNCKQKIRLAVGEDYTDYKNEDFELIK
jgi:DNA-directed RNA polymerase specialized sigma24 family protein